MTSSQVHGGKGPPKGPVDVGHQRGGYGGVGRDLSPWCRTRRVYGD